MIEFHATTICAVRRGPDDICIGGDGQVTMGEHTIMKNGAKKVRKIYKNTVVTGFAGSVADAFALTDKFEKKLDEHSGNLKRAAVDLAQIWRSDKGMRSLEALMIVADKDQYARHFRKRRGHRAGSGFRSNRLGRQFCIFSGKCFVQ